MMKSILNLLIVTISFSVMLYSCSSNENKTENKDNKNNTENSSPVKIVIDSNAIHKVKKELPDISVSKEGKPATKEEINSMVSSNKHLKNEDQKIIQSFLEASANKDFNKAASFLAYNGKDKNRKNKDSYDMTVPNEIKIVKSTVDVIYSYLEKSKRYDFISYKHETRKNIGKVGVVEVSFFRKGLGIDRLYFDVLDTPKGKMIVGMR